MKKRISLMIALSLALMLLCACAGESKTYLPSQEAQTSLINNSDSGSIAVLGDYYYKMAGNMNSYLYRIDPQTKESVIVCNKPDCLHDKETDSTRTRDCNAFAEFTNGTLLRYGDKLYAYLHGNDLDRKDRIQEFAPDGSGQRTIVEFDRYVTAWTIHRGYLYVTITDFVAFEKQFTDDDACSVYRYDMEKNTNNPEVVYEVTDQFTQISALHAAENDLYMTEVILEDETTMGTTRRVLHVQLDTLEVNCVVEQSAGEAAVIPGGVATSLLDEDEMYHLAAFDKNGNQLFCSDFSSSASYKVFADEQYIYADNQREAMFDESGATLRTLSVVDFEGNRLNQIAIEKEALPFKGATDEYIFYYKRIPQEYADSQYYVSYPLMAIDKKDILQSDPKVETFYIYVATTNYPGVTVQ